MKLFGQFVLIVLVLHSCAKYEKDDDDSYEESKPALRRYNVQQEVLKRLLYEIQDSRSYKERLSEMDRRADAVANKAKSGTPLLNFTVVHRGLYLANAKVNILRNGLQDEFSTNSMAYGTREVYELQKLPNDTISYLRIRFHAIGAGDLTDIQVKHPKSSDLCYVLTGTLMSPVYAKCAPGEDYSRK